MSGFPRPSPRADDAGTVGMGELAGREGGAPPPTRPGDARPGRIPITLFTAFWLAGAYGVAPRVIASAYRGESLERLNRIFATRRGKPLEHFLGLWWDLAGAVNLAALAWLGLAVWVGRRVEDRRRRRVSILHAALFLLMTVLAGPRHDYVAFAEIWRNILNGADPWSIHPVYGYATHAYGPAFNLLAWPFAINPLLPKILCASAFLAYAATQPRGPLLGLVTLFAWTEVAWFGHFDVLVGLTCVAACRALAKGREIGAGVAMGVGILLKIVPAALAPFLAMRGWAMRGRTALAIVASVALGYALAYGIWGPSVFRPFGFAAGRASTFASIFRFLRGEGSPLRWVWAAPDLDRWSGPTLLVSGLILFVWTRWRRVGPTEGTALAALLTVLAYQVGFLQYQMVVMLLLLDLLAGRWSGLSRGLKGALVSDLGWIGCLNVWYVSIGGVIHPGDPWAWADEWVGLPTFGLGVFLLNRLASEVGRPDWA